MGPRGPYTRSAATRRRLLDLLAQRPGATRAELARASGLSWGVVASHLATMEARGEVTSVAAGRKRSYRRMA